MIIKKEVTITNKEGLHVRAANLIVRAATKYKADIFLIKKENNSNLRVTAKSVISVLSLEGTMHTRLIIEAEGEDAEEAVEEIKKLFENNFNV